MSLLKVAFFNIKRNKKNFFLSSFGIIVGVMIFIFFSALSQGMKEIVNNKIFDTSANFLTIKSQTPLNDASINEIKKWPEVKDVYPIQNMDVPFMVEGKILGNYFRMDAIAYGLSNKMIRKDLRNPEVFKYDKNNKFVPVVISQEVFEIYNGSYAISHGMPRLSPLLLSNYPFKIVLGKSFVRGRVGNKPVKRLKARVVGVSKQVPLGFSVPIGYLKEWRAEYNDKKSSELYDKLVIKARNKDMLTELKSKVMKDKNYIAVTDNNERINFFISIVMMLFLVISLIIIAISAINIMQTFYSSINTRIKEIAVMRALGATKSYIKNMILLESSIIGIFGGILGVTFALLLSYLIDWFSNNKLPDFPYKPDTYFSFPLWLILTAIPFAMFFCILGAYFPARKAANLDPSSSLTMQQ